MSVLLDARPIGKAVAAAVTGQLGGSFAYDRASIPGGNRVQGTLPNLYAVVDVERRFDESARRAGAPAGTSAWRISVGGVGRTVVEAEWVLAKATAALEDVWLATAEGNDFLCRFETYRAPEFDDGRFYGSVTFTCAT